MFPGEKRNRPRTPLLERTASSEGASVEAASDKVERRRTTTTMIDEDITFGF